MAGGASSSSPALGRFPSDGKLTVPPRIRNHQNAPASNATTGTPSSSGLNPPMVPSDGGGAAWYSTRFDFRFFPDLPPFFPVR